MKMCLGLSVQEVRVLREALLFFMEEKPQEDSDPATMIAARNLEIRLQGRKARSA